MNWWRRLTGQKRLEEQLDKELRFHVEERAAALVECGIDRQEARRRALVEFGGLEPVKEQCRDARGARWLEDLAQDVRYALRTLRQRPGFSVIALATLALGIGATTVMFTVIRGVLLRPLPYAAPQRLVALDEQTDWSTHWGNLWAFAYPNYLDCRNSATTLDLAAWRFGDGILTKPGEAENVEAREISAGLFSVLGVPLYAGREFRPEEDRRGGAPVAIVGYHLWQRRFAASPSAIGAEIVFQGKPYTVVGVTSPGFRLMGDTFDLYLPLGQDTAANMQNRDAHALSVVGRLRPGATLGQAQAEFAGIGRRIAQQFPASNRGRIFIANPLRPPVDDVKGTLWLLLGAVTLVLLIACANIASLLLARAVSRERELAMRVALGAGRGRLVRQCLTESCILALGGGALGVLLAAFGWRPFVAFWPGSLPRAEEIGLDARVLLFAVGVSLLCGVLFGIAPALRVPVHGLEKVLRSGGRAVTGSSRRLHFAFVVAEIALAVVLLVSAGTLGRALLRLASVDPGLNPRNVLTARTALDPGTLADAGRTRAAWQEILDRVRRVPGTEAAAIVDTVPLREGNNPIGYRTSSAAVPADRQPLVSATCTTPGYLEVMGIALLRGRFLTDHDRLGSEPVVVLDEVMAREAFGSSDPIGRYVWIGLDDRASRVVGVVRHVRHWGASDDDPAQVRAELYYPLAQVPDRLMRRWSELMSLAVRTGVPPRSLVEPVKRAVRGAGRDQVIYEIRTMEELAEGALALQRFLMLLFGIFAALALLLASMGIYGVLAYVTGRRIPEFGVRMALGAGAADVMRLVFQQSLGMIAVGAALGLAGALAAAHLLARLVAGIRPADPFTVAGMLLVLTIAALFASFLPARRAARVDPIRALRQE